MATLGVLVAGQVGSDARSHGISTAFVIVAPGESACDAKWQHWKAWSEDASAFGVDMHLLVDGAASELSPSYWRAGPGNSIPIHQMANESTVMARFKRMQV